MAELTVVVVSARVQLAVLGQQQRVGAPAGGLLHVRRLAPVHFTRRHDLELERSSQCRMNVFQTKQNFNRFQQQKNILSVSLSVTCTDAITMPKSWFRQLS